MNVIRKFFHLAVLFFTLVVCSIAPASALESLVQVKAVFLYKFTDYVQWPLSVQPQPGEGFSICVWGINPFGNVLEQIAKRQSKYRYEIRYYRLGEKPQNCHIVFTSDAAPAQIRSVRNALTVSDGKGFAEKGAMVEMKEENKKIRLAVNLNLAEKHEFKFSSRLLSIVDVLR